MKKTIAILLVLVIGMVGVFAAETATATLNLATTVTGVNRIAITGPDTDKYYFPALGEGEEVFDLAYNSLDFAVANAFNNATVNVGYIHYKTNNANGVTVTMSGTYLSNASNSDLFIPYTLTVIDNDDTSNNKSISPNGTTTEASVTLFSAEYSPLFTDSRLIQISGVLGDADDYPAGLYSATVTFTLTAN